MMTNLTPVRVEALSPADNSELVVYAADQPQYQPLPVRKFPDGKVFSEWELTEEEKESLIDALLAGKRFRVRLWQYTFNQPLQPVMVELV